MHAERSAAGGGISEFLAKITSMCYDFSAQNLSESQERCSVFSNDLQATMINWAKG